MRWLILLLWCTSLQAVEIVACAEGEFRDIDTDTCKVLHKPDFGFDFAAFHFHHPNGGAHDITAAASPTQATLQTHLATLASLGGGTLTLVAGNTNLTTGLFIPSNTKIIGAGPTTTLTSASWAGDSNSMLRVEYSTGRGKRHIWISEMKLIGSAGAHNGIDITESRNVLIEHVEFTSMTKSGVAIVKSQGITMRYNDSHDNTIHGLASKDCDVNISMDGADGTGADGEISLSECFASQSYASSLEHFKSGYMSIHSNELTDNGVFGVDAHIEFVEVAGNSMDGNAESIKAPDGANDGWYHHNEFINTTDNNANVKINHQYAIGAVEMQPIRQYWYLNRLENSNGLGTRINDRALDIWLSENTATGNVTPAININATVEAHYCPGDGIVAEAPTVSDYLTAESAAHATCVELDRLGDL